MSSEDAMTASGTKTPKQDGDKAGYRAAEAFVRPHPIAVHGDITSHGFDLRSCTFSLSLSAASPTEKDAPTHVFLPDWHFPSSETSVEVSGGKWSIEIKDDQQTLSWWHMEGNQTITVKGLVRKQGAAVGSTGEDEGYLEQCQRTACTVM
jgi:hypothetical protein